MLKDCDFVRLTKTYINGFHKVVPFTEKYQLLLMNFTDKNKELAAEILKNTAQFTDYISEKLQDAGAVYGIGGYNEHRTIYSRSDVFDGAEPRRLHLGIDIWGAAGTPVYAPLQGTVHSLAFNNAYGDYGATIILSHHVNGMHFHTLYGHLSLASIRNIKEGDTINKGDVFAEFGTPQENGNWPPHLHFQIIKDMQGMKGDYPGVCKYSEREKYMENCPDADVILGMMQYVKIK